MMKRPENFSWLLSSNEKSQYSARDIYEIFGYCSPESLTSAVVHKNFPPKDVTIQTKWGKPLTRWSKKTVVAEIRRRIKLTNKEN